MFANIRVVAYQHVLTVGGVLPIDVNWWTEEAVIVAYSTGDIVVADLEE